VVAEISVVLLTVLGKQETRLWPVSASKSAWAVKHPELRGFLQFEMCAGFNVRKKILDRHWMHHPGYHFYPLESFFIRSRAFLASRLTLVSPYSAAGRTRRRLKKIHIMSVQFGLTDQLKLECFHHLGHHRMVPPLVFLVFAMRSALV
jgi:hypothetical protein